MSDEPLTDAEIEALGYRVKDGRWFLIDPDARPQNRPELCRMCSKFDAMDGGWCAGCLWFGPGDPHGLRQRSPEVGIEQRELPRTADRAARLTRMFRRIKESR